MKNLLNFAVVGVGGIGQGHVSGVLKAPNANLVAVCDPKGKEIWEYRKTYFPKEIIPDVPLFTDYEEMLQSVSLDAVILSTPDVTHLPMAVKAFELGIDVLCEKPLTLTREEAMEMMKASKKYGRRFFVGQICRFSPAFRKAKELLDSGIIGNVFCVESQYVHGCHENLPTDNWRKNPPRHATSCGGCHAIDLVRYLIGDPEEVFAYGNRLCRTDWEVEDCSETLMKFPGGAIGRVMTSLGNIYKYSMKTVIFGTKGTIEANNVEDTVLVYTRDENRVISETKYKVDINSHNALEEIQDMCEAILFGKKVCHEGIEGVKTVCVCSAAISSIASGKPERPDYPVMEA
ncbi:MAG: Gfo/Idh/MocA family oxidoreductase [Clostridia bacterium]|nr:Gfo/Idh/MocA family oxidoreductase [Clostridia bacterium]